MLQVDRGNVQGLIFQSYNYPLVGHFFFQFPDRAAARNFLREWLPRVTTASVDLSTKPTPLTNIALSWSGLAKTGAVDDRPGTFSASLAFPGDFLNPPNPKAMRDSGASAPANWWKGRFVSKDVDVAVFSYCQTEASLAQQTAAIRESANRFGLKELVPSNDGQPLTGQLAPKGILHFGYRDGISQPQINWDDAPGQTGLADLRHFLLGYGNEQVESIPSQEPWNSMVRDGCYLVLRWIYQDVAKFNKFLREKSAELWPAMPAYDRQELLAAKMMGRWRNGTPLMLYPNGPEQDPAKFMRNDFSYASDPNGDRCPFAAHIRIANRRDDELNDRNKPMFPPGRPRVLRRGSSYGPHLDGENDDGKDRGLVGMFLCTDIESQFFALMRWINETNFQEKNTNLHGQDPLFGNRDFADRSDTFEFSVNGNAHVLSGLQDFIRTQGVLNLFLPSVAALRQISAP